MTPTDVVAKAVEEHAAQTANVKRGQKWFSYLAGFGATVVILPLAVRYALGLFGAFGLEPLGGGQVWLGFGFGLGFSLASAAFAQVALGASGAKLLEKLTPGAS